MKLGLLFPAVAAASAVTPVQKVIQMMQGMLAKGQADMAAEAKLYEEYSAWVHDQDRDTKLDLGNLNSKIERFDAQQLKAESEAASLAQTLGEESDALAAFDGELQRATAQRADEKAAFDVTEQDLSESVDALGRAISTLSAKAGKMESLSLVQGLAVAVPRASPQLLAFLQEPQAKEYGYEFQGGGIVSLLEGLEKKFKGELSDSQIAESNAAHNYQMMKSNLENSIEQTKQSMNTHTEEKASQEGTAARAKGQLADATADKVAAEKYLEDLHTMYTLKTGSFEENQKVRTEEIGAISKAIEIISGGAVSGSADKHLPSLIQKSRSTSFLQVREKLSVKRNVISRVTRLLQQRNSVLLHNQSHVLSLAAIRMAEGGPFDKIVGLIKDLISRLQEEAAAEAEHKAFCDKELHDNKVVRDRKTQSVDNLTAIKEEKNAQIAALADEIAKLEAAEAALQKAMGEATEQRSAEKAKNTATVKDAKAAQEALSQALSVLRDFYAKAGGAFIQQVPEMKAYKGQQASSGGVVGMLEVIQSDFARLEADTSAAEAQAAAEYDTFITDAKADKEAKHKDAFDKSMLKDQTEHEVHMNQKDLDATTAELNAALDYYDKLKPQCLTVKVSYAERVQMREQEIAALREALDILNESDGTAMLG